MPLIDHARLTGIARRVFAAAGSDEEEAGIVADHLVEANLKGHDSHGVGMIPSYLRNLGAGKAVANQPGRVVTDSGSMLVYDGERGYGQIVARNATLLGIERAKRDGSADGHPPWPTGAGAPPGRRPGPPAVPVDAGAVVRATLKLEPLLSIADGTASG